MTTRTARKVARAARKPAAPHVATAMRDHADAATALLQAIGSRNRLLLLCQLVAGERSVGELVDALGLAQSVVSQHLALLRHAGIVTGRREAQSIRYRIADARAEALMATLFDLFCGSRAGQGHA
ncbi:MAG TPA: metalloregulator ArsR/SmtB family transcription factor [Rhodanobacteraceae bacterium]